MARILVVDDETGVRSSLAIALGSDGHEVEAAADAEEAEGFFQKQLFDLVLMDERTNASSGADLLELLRRDAPRTQVIVMTAFGTIEGAVHAMRHGAHNYLTKPFEPNALRSAIDKALRQREAGPEPDSLPRAGMARRPFPEIIGESRAMRDLLDLVAKVAATDSTALITGETGTGKELIGRAIHASSRRNGRIFCAVNSAAFPETLLESELFGHRRGSFTGAGSNKKGLFECADRGTVFLDEVAEMPLSMQAKLLRFLQTGEIRPIGSEQTRIVDVRLVTATNKDLEKEVEAGRFREDLYYRLAVIPIHVPALRERVQDVPLLAAHFLTRFAAKLGKKVQRIEPAAMDLLCAYPWPGNVRELENALERCVALCGSDSIGTADLSSRIRQRAPFAETEALESLEVVERLHILNTLERVGWNRKKAAKVLRISTTTLWRRLKEFGIDGANPERPSAGARVIQG